MSCGVTASELAQIQADVVSVTCDKTCSIYRKTKTTDGMGSATEDWRLVETTVVGMVEPSAGLLQNYDFEVASLEAVQLHLPVGTDIAVDDHAVIEGQTFNVHVVLTPRSYQTLLTVLVAELK